MRIKDVYVNQQSIKKNKHPFPSSPRAVSRRSPRDRQEILAQLPPSPDHCLCFTSIFRPIPALRPTEALPLRTRAAPRVELFPGVRQTARLAAGPVFRPASGRSPTRAERQSVPARLPGIRWASRGVPRQIKRQRWPRPFRALAG